MSSEINLQQAQEFELLLRRIKSAVKNKKSHIELPVLSKSTLTMLEDLVDSAKETALDGMSGAW